MVTAGGSVTIKTKKVIPDEILKLTKEKYGVKFEQTKDENKCYLEFDGNWRLDTVIDTTEFIEPYITEGQITYWSDEGDAYAVFKDGVWSEEWEEKFYFCDLPDERISSTERVKEIIHCLMTNSECNFTERELKLYEIEH